MKMFKLCSIVLGGLLMLLSVEAFAGAVGVSPQAGRGLTPAVRKTANVRWEVEKYPDGKIKCRTPYVNGVKHGVAEEFFGNGNIKSKTPYNKGKIHGVLETYWDINKVAVQSKTTYVDGVKQGEMTGWHHNGNILNKRFYKNGQLQGEDLQYHPAAPGKVKVQRYWTAGLLEGEEVRYDDQGRILSSITWKAGKKDGPAFVFGFSHEVRVEESWKTGALQWRREFQHFALAGGVKKIKQYETFNNAHKLHGKCEYWRAPEVLEKVLFYSNGKLHGICEFYDGNGKLIRREKWLDGSKIANLPVGISGKRPARKVR